jgi:hypothetical protein
MGGSLVPHHIVPRVLLLMTSRPRIRSHPRMRNRALCPPPRPLRQGSGQFSPEPGRRAPSRVLFEYLHRDAHVAAVIHYRSGSRVCLLRAELAKLASQSDAPPNSVEESDLHETLVAQGSAELSTTQRDAAEPGHNLPLTHYESRGRVFESPRARFLFQ